MAHTVREHKHHLRRSIVSWVLLLVLILITFFSALGALTREFYSASGFVRTYLQALALHDADSALRMPGVTLPDNLKASEKDLLFSSALGNLHNIEIVSDVPGESGQHRVTAAYELTPSGTVRSESSLQSTPGAHPGIQNQTDFIVQETFPALGLFPRWRFQISPIATVTVTLKNADSFTVGASLVHLTTATAESGGSESYPVLVPNLYFFDHASTYLEATPSPTAITRPGSTSSVVVDAQANSRFISAVQTEIDNALDECAHQKVLYPVSCPFGKALWDRLESDPSWSISTYPTVTITSQNGVWRMLPTQALAHLSVDVRSLFDGSVTMLSEEIPFTVSYIATLATDNSIKLLPN